jgi:ethanolamine ammonia-lyase large subunit
LFGQANEWKEGDHAQGIAATSPEVRIAARTQISHLRIGDIYPSRFGPTDEQIRYVETAVDTNILERISGWTIQELKCYLLSESESSIRLILPGLRSEVIAAVVKLMTNEELTQVASKIYNPVAPGETLGAQGRFSSRIQPNSATDDPQEVLISVLEGLRYERICIAL